MRSEMQGLRDRGTKGPIHLYLPAIRRLFRGIPGAHNTELDPNLNERSGRPWDWSSI